MRLFLFAMILWLAGCQQLLNGQQQPVVLKNPAKNIWFTTCSGAVETWYNCDRKAESTCKNGFYEINRQENIVGGKRELTFKCN